MRVIYHSSAPGINPQVVSAIHLKILPREREPTEVEWKRVLYRKGFDRRDQGRIFLMGKTGAGDEIYVLAYPAKGGALVRKVVESALRLIDLSPWEVVVVDCGRIGRAVPKSDALPEAALKSLYPLLVDLVEKVERGAVR